jgi:hypothetical protein
MSYFEFDDARRFHQPYTDPYTRMAFWKPPAYNSPYQNWKRGMYAVSTGVFLVEPIRHLQANMTVLN